LGTPTHKERSRNKTTCLEHVAPSDEKHSDKSDKSKLALHTDPTGHKRREKALKPPVFSVRSP